MARDLYNYSAKAVCLYWKFALERKQNDSCYLHEATGVCEKNDRRYIGPYKAILILGRKIRVETHIVLYRCLLRRSLFSQTPVSIARSLAYDHRSASDHPSSLPYSGKDEHASAGCRRGARACRDYYQAVPRGNWHTPHRHTLSCPNSLV